jgi:hypothetical protein
LVAVCAKVVVLMLGLFSADKLNVNTTTVTYTATKDNPHIFILLF